MESETEKPIEKTSQEVPVKKVSMLPVITIILGILILLVLVFIAGYVVLGNKKTSETALIKPTSIPTNTNENSAISPAAQLSPSASASSETVQVAEGQEKYINHTYGFSFEFPTVLQGEPINVKEVGNKIYVYNFKYPYTQGQYVEIFPKSASDTLDQAIQKQFLTNIAPKDCFVKDAKGDTLASFPATYSIKTLGYPVDENTDVPAFAQPNKCPEPYAATNGISYFLGDSKHPKFYLFFSIGQYGIDVQSPQKKGWQDTVLFTD